MPGFLVGPQTGFMDRMKGKGMCSSGFLQQVGKGAALSAGGGSLAATITASIVPGSINTDNVLVAWTIPANTLDISGRTLMIVANGSVANNTNNKRIKIFAGCTTAPVGSAVTGGTVIADTGTYNTTGAAGWSIGAQISKYGAGGSNTQVGVHSPSVIGGTSSVLVVPQLLTLNETASFIIAITGNATTTANDIVLNYACLDGYN